MIETRNLAPGCEPEVSWPASRPAGRTNEQLVVRPEDVATRVVAALQAVDAGVAEAEGRLAAALPRFPRAGDTFLDFTLLAELGRGAFGRVFLAQQQGLAERPVAVKIAVDLHQESQLLARLQHTNIVPVYSVHRTGGLQAVCMPYFGGTTLAHVYRHLVETGQMPISGRVLASTVRDHRRSTLRPGGPGSAPPGAEPAPEPDPAEGLPPRSPFHELVRMDYVRSVLWLIARLVEGLGHAHDRGILHLDLKPANILLTDEGEPMLLDFNLAEDRTADSAARASVGGTLPYMSPEQLEAFQGKPAKLTPASDLYSLGVILFELLTGQPPFPSHRDAPLAEALPAMLADRRKGAPALRRLNRNVSPAVEAIVRRCLDPNPARRYQSAQDLREDLQRQLHDRPLKHTPEPSVWERVAKFRRRHPRLLSVTSCVLALVVGVLALGSALYWRGERVARLEATAAAQGLRDDRRELEFLLTARSARHQVEPALAHAEQARARFGAGGAGLDRLDGETRDQARQDLREVAWLSAQAHLLRVDPTNPAGSLADLDRAELLLAEAAQGYEADAVPLAVRWQQARIARLRGQEVDAQAAESQTRAEPPRTARDWYLLAFALAEQGKFRQALDHVTESVERAPDEFNPWFLRGICCDALGRDGESVVCYTVCTALRPTFFASYFNRGLAHARQRRFQAARRDFDQVVRLRPDHGEAYFNRALTYREPGELAAAEADLTRAQEHGFDPTRLCFVRARVREQVGDRDGAARDRADGLKRTPTDADSWVARGLARLPADPAGALADFDAALELHPRSLAALQNKAHVLVKYQKKTDEAVAVLDGLVALYPEDVRPRAGRGVLLARLGRDDAAKTDAEAALALDDGAANQYQVAGIHALLSRRDPAQADVAFRLLSSALKKGFGAELLAIDPELTPLRNDPRYGQVVALARALSAAR